jgi:hypothetical protein
MKVLVVGGGTAGLVTALILKKHLNIQVDVVHSSALGIIGVGEGSTEHFSDFMKFVGINQQDLITNCDATYKSGILFEGWASNPYLHSIHIDYSVKNAQYPYVYGKQISENSDYLTSSIPWSNRIPKWFINKGEELPYNQFHFNTYKLNEYLVSFAQNMGISVFDDEITDVEISASGNIESVTGLTNTYSYDFYIDATGFKKLLIGKLGAKWASVSKYLKMKSAVVFQTEDEENYSLWTLAKAMDNGWMFRLPVWGRYGNGYIFDSDYTTMDKAKQEVVDLFGKDINFGKEFNFDAGYLEESWIKNCVAVGLSSVFYEPLEASSIGTTIQQSFLLMHRLANYSDSSIKSYNKSYIAIVENVRDFIALHYVTKKTNTQFWSDVSKVELPDSLQEKLEHWKTHLPIKEDFSSSSEYLLFHDSNFTVVMHGLGLFNAESIKKEFNLFSDNLKLKATNQINALLEVDRLTPTVTHKEFLRITRELS